MYFRMAIHLCIFQLEISWIRTFIDFKYTFYYIFFICISSKRKNSFYYSFSYTSKRQYALNTGFERSRVRVLKFIATFNNISVISWWSVLLVEETGENHRPAASHWQTSSHNVLSSTPRLSEIQTGKRDNHTGDVIWWTNIMGFDTLCLTIAFVNITTLLANITILIFLLRYTGSVSWGGDSSVFVVTCFLKI